MKPEVGSLWRWVKSTDGVVKIKPSYHSDYVSIIFSNDPFPNEFGLPLDEFMRDFIPLTELEKELL